MGSSDPTPPAGMKATHVFESEEPTAKLVKKPTDDADDAEPVVREISLGGSVPRVEPATSPALGSGDIYIRLEGRIYGPFKVDEMEELLASGKLTGLEAASSDLHRWTPLAYHPRMVRRRVRDFDKAHDALLQMSALPAKKSLDYDLPLAAIVKRPKLHDADSAVTVEELKTPVAPSDKSSPSTNET